MLDRQTDKTDGRTPRWGLITSLTDDCLKTSFLSSFPHWPVGDFWFQPQNHYSVRTSQPSVLPSQNTSSTAASDAQYASSWHCWRQKEIVTIRSWWH